ncbi:MAG: NAD(P)/FAD-dependent oxidoreductase, partial [Paracoccaceae bacterium]
MPFEAAPVAPRRIAVIGGGISGLGAAHFLGDAHRVTLFEAEPRLGGHARTVIAGKRGDQPVDTGFIVFNYANYPHLARLFADLDVPVTESNMSFGASFRGGRLEYALRDLDSLFAQRSNCADPRFYRMVRDILRFNARGYELSRREGMSISDLLTELRTGPWFRDHYLLPFSGAIWSVPKEKILDFPARTMLDFFRNHALLGASGQHQWYTVQGGSVEYVRRLEADLRRRDVDLRPGCPVGGVRRTPAGVEIAMRDGAPELFDEVVFATHSDIALRLLADPSQEEHALLSAVRYQPNEIVLHSDTSIMPRRRKVWSSWNYTEAADKRSDRIDVTYWMNSLQPIPEDDPLFVTLNSTRPIREELIHDTVTLDHPVYDAGAIAAQRRVPEINGTNRTWFCGAWVRNGFHEDGLS